MDTHGTAEAPPHTGSAAGDVALLLGVARMLASPGNPRDALHEVIYRLTDALGMDRGSVLLRGDDEDVLYVVAASESRHFSRLAVQLRRYPEVRSVLQTGQPLVVENAPEHPLMREVADLISSRGIGSLALFPLVLDDEPRGALMFRSAALTPPLGHGEVALGRLVASILSLALHNQRILDAIREQTRRVHVSRLAAQRRRKAIDRFRELFEGSSDGTVAVDAEGETLYVNRAAEQITGFAAESLVGRSFLERVAADHRDGLREILAQVFAGERVANFDLDLITPSGDPVLASVSTTLQHSDDPIAVLSFRDVTEARYLQEELRKTRDFLAHLIDSVVDAIVAADLSGTVLLFNKGAEKVFGYGAAEVVGRLTVERLYPPGAARQVMRELRDPGGGGVGRLEPCRKEILTRDGKTVPVNLTAAIVYQDGREVATVGVFSDLRDRLRMEQRLFEAQAKLAVTEKQALLTELAGATAHELNQPLTSIMGYAELLQRRIAAEDPTRRAIDTIYREAARMAQVVRKIGTITRYETKTYTGHQRILDLDKTSPTALAPEGAPEVVGEAAPDAAGGAGEAGTARGKAG